MPGAWSISSSVSSGSITSRIPRHAGSKGKPGRAVERAGQGPRKGSVHGKQSDRTGISDDAVTSPSRSMPTGPCREQGAGPVHVDHVILLDGISTLYPGEHPADPVQRDMISRAKKDAEGCRLLYVAVTRAKRSLAVLAPTDLHPRLETAPDLAKL